MDQSGNTRNFLLLSLLLAAVTLAIFWPVGHHDFINFDDPDYVTENEWVKRGLTGAGVHWAFTTGHAGNWHPVTWLSHMLDVTLFGLEAGKHHLVNLGFHVANAILLLVLLNSMTGALWRSAFVAALFAIHPLHVESVAWVAERKDVLSTFFGLLTLIAYGRFAQCKMQNAKCKIAEEELGGGGQYKITNSKLVSGGKVWFGAALAFFALGLMSKAMLVTWPFVMLLLDVWPLNRISLVPRVLSLASWRVWKRLVIEKLPFFALTIASSFVTSLVQSQGGAVSTAGNLPLDDRLANAFASYLKYLGKTFWPTDLAIFYPHPDLRYPASEQWPLALIVTTALLLIGISVLAIRRLKQQPYLATGWFWYLGTLVPVIGIIQVGTQAMADRYSYVPLIGIFICVVWAGTDLLTHLRIGRAALALVGTAAVAACVVVTHFQVQTWQNDLTVFGHALAVTRNNHVAQSILGKALARQGKNELALEHFRAALAAYPNHADAHQDLGATFYTMGKYQEAIEQFQAQLQARPNQFRTYSGLGAAYWALGADDKAQENYAQALSLNPDYPPANHGMGAVLFSKGRFTEASVFFARTLERMPNHTDALGAQGRTLAFLGRWTEAETYLRRVVTPDAAPDLQVALGHVLAETGRTNEAKPYFDNARRQEPKLAEQYLQQGKVYLASGQAQPAWAAFSIAARLDPESAAAQENLGLLLAAQGKLPEAVPHLEKSLQIQPSAKGFYHLALAMALQGDARKAVTHLEQALALNPDLPAALNDLAWILATHSSSEIRNGRKAVALAEGACRISEGKEPRYWGTLDAAYAEAGRFAEAIQTAEKTRTLAVASGHSDVAKAAEERLALYRVQQPYHK